MKSDYQYLFSEILNLWSDLRRLQFCISGADGGNFLEVPWLREEISVIWLHILLLGNKNRPPFESNEKNHFSAPCYTINNLDIFFIHFMGYWEYFFKLAIYVQRGRRYKIGADGGHFSEVQNLRKEILVIWLHILLLGNYITLFLKLEPATIYKSEENA